MNSIFKNNSFVVFTTQSDFVYFLCVNIMSVRVDDIHLCQLSFCFKETVFRVFMCNFISYHVLLDSFALFFPSLHTSCKNKVSLLIQQILQLFYLLLHLSSSRLLFCFFLLEFLIYDLLDNYLYQIFDQHLEKYL